MQGIAELITRPGLINVDFADVRTVMSEMGMAMMGSGIGTRRAPRARRGRAGVPTPLLEDVNLAGAHGILVNVTAGPDLSIGEFEEVGDTVKQFAAEDATVVVGTVIEPEMQDELRVTVVATGLNRSKAKVAAPARGPAGTAAVTRRNAATSSWWRSATTRTGAGLQRTSIARRSTASRSARSATDCAPTSARRTCSTSRRSCAARPTEAGRSRDRGERDGLRARAAAPSGAAPRRGPARRRQRERDPPGSRRDKGNRPPAFLRWPAAGDPAV